MNKEKKVKVETTDKIPFYKKASFKYSSLSTALIAGFIILIIGFNMLAGFVAERFTLDVDLTVSGDYSVSEDNKAVIESIDKPVEIICTTSEEYYTDGSYYQALYTSGIYDKTGGKYMKQTVELLKNYQKLNSNITLKFVDAQTPAFDDYRELFSAYMDAILYGDYIVYCEETGKHKFLSNDDIYAITTDTSSYYSSTSVITGSNVETAFTSALDYTTSATDDIVTIVTGYNSSDTSELQTLFEENNYEIHTIDTLMKDDIPEETDILLLAAPTVDLTLDEIKEIDAYLNNNGKYGKNLFYFGSSTQLSTPNLDALMLDWGIKFDYGTVFETDDNYALSSDGLNTAMMVNLADSDAATDIGADYQGADFVGGSMRPMTVAIEENSKYHTYDMLVTNDTATVMPNGASDDWRPASDAATQQYSAMILSVYVTGDKDNEGEEIRSNVCAFSGIECISWSTYYSTIKTNNLLIDTANYTLNKDETSYTFVNKEISTNAITVTEGQTRVVKVVFWAVPVVIIAIGVVVYFRRKSR